MGRSRLCRICKEFHALEGEWPQACWSHFAPRGDAAPSVRADGMDAIRSQADGKMYDSKSAYYGSVKRAGCEIVADDIGGFGPRPEYHPQGVGQDVKKAIEQLRSRG